MKSWSRRFSKAHPNLVVVQEIDGKGSHQAQQALSRYSSEEYAANANAWLANCPSNYLVVWQNDEIIDAWAWSGLSGRDCTIQIELPQELKELL